MLRGPFRTLAFCAALSLPFVAASSAQAQKYPDKPVRVILPFGAGGVADVTARLVAEKLGDKLGQRFVIENNPGAGGIGAARAVMQSPPDGYTLALFSNGTAVSVGLFKSLPFDPVKDFVPVSAMGYFDTILATNAQGPYKTLGDFIKAAKEKPGTLNIGTIAAGSTQNLAAELFKTTAGIDVVIVPFKTSGEALIGLERNDVQMVVEFFAALRGGLEAKKFIPVATSGAQAATYLSGVPTVKAAGGGDYEATSWNAIYAPAGTPADVVKTLNAAMNQVLADPEVRQRALGMGIEAKGSTPYEIQARLKSDIEKWGKVIDKAGIEKR
ncbi:MAG: Bug family tripartite tricarboxylate transporter substrate binding protein [Pseudorhodoplanes sp.]